MTFWKAFAVSYFTLLGFFVLLLLTTYVEGSGPRHPRAAAAVLLFGPPLFAVTGWSEMRKKVQR